MPGVGGRPHSNSARTGPPDRTASAEVSLWIWLPLTGLDEVWGPERLTMFGKKALAWRLSSILKRAGRSMMSCSVSPSSFLRMSRFQSKQRWAMGKKGGQPSEGTPLPRLSTSPLPAGDPALQGECQPHPGTPARPLPPVMVVIKRTREKITEIILENHRNNTSEGSFTEHHLLQARPCAKCLLCSISLNP